MGACIVQDKKPVVFWSCKLNDAQLKYTVGDKELLSIAIVLKFCIMLLVAKLHILTDHLNITTNNNTPDSVICWLNHVEQYNPCIHFIPGKNHVIADTQPWFHRLESTSFLKEGRYFSSNTLFQQDCTLLMIVSSSRLVCVLSMERQIHVMGEAL